MDYSDYFESENIKLLRDAMAYHDDQLGKKIHFLTDDKFDFEKYDIALIGVPDISENTQSGLKDTPDIIRKFLFNLYAVEKISVIDLGNLINTGSIENTYLALRDVISSLVSKNINPVLIGGGLHLNYAVYLALANEKIECNINIVSPKVNYSINENTNNPDFFISKILNMKDNYLFNYSNIGYQEYYNSEKNIKKLNDLFFDTVRLGIARNNLIEVEPYLRNSNIIGFDIASVRYSDAPGFHFANPNGFYGEELCQLAKYAGMSEENIVFGIYNVNPDFDRNNITSHLAAQIIWYYITGYYQSKLFFNDLISEKNLLKFNVHIDKGNYSMIFYKNKLTEKWWMEIPQNNLSNTRKIACTYADYQAACNNELPNRWWKAYQKSI